MTALSAHWATICGWFAAIVAGLTLAIQSWRNKRSLMRERCQSAMARAEAADARVRATIAEVETQAAQDMIRKLAALNEKAKHDDDGGLADHISRLNRGAGGR